MADDLTNDEIEQMGYIEMMNETLYQEDDKKVRAFLEILDRDNLIDLVWLARSIIQTAKKMKNKDIMLSKIKGD